MFNRLPGAMLSLGHTHQWRKGRSCSRVLSQHNAEIGRPIVTGCSIRRAGGRAFFGKTEVSEAPVRYLPERSEALRRIDEV